MAAVKNRTTDRHVVQAPVGTLACDRKGRLMMPLGTLFCFTVVAATVTIAGSVLRRRAAAHRVPVTLAFSCRKR